MEKINIGQDSSNLLSYTLIRLANYYSRNSKVDGVFMCCYNDMLVRGRELVPTVNLVLMVTDLLEKSELGNLSEVLQEVEAKTGVKLTVNVRDSEDYCLAMMSSRIDSAYRSVLNGQILFDRTGKYGVLQFAFKKSQDLRTGAVKYVEFEPSLKLEKVKR